MSGLIFERARIRKEIRKDEAMNFEKRKEK